MKRQSVVLSVLLTNRRDLVKFRSHSLALPLPKGFFDKTVYLPLGMPPRRSLWFPAFVSPFGETMISMILFTCLTSSWFGAVLEISRVAKISGRHVDRELHAPIGQLLFGHAVSFPPRFQADTSINGVGLLT